MSHSNRSSPASTTSFHARQLVYHLHRVNSGPTACIPLPPCQFECNCSSPASTTSFQARPLIYHLHHVNSCPIARLPPPLHQFESICSCPTPSVNLSAVTRLLPPPCLFEPSSLSATSTASIRAQLLVFHLHHMPSNALELECLSPTPTVSI